MSLFSILIIGFPELAQKFNQIPEFALAKNITHGKHGRRGMLPLGNLIFGYMLYLPTGRLKRQRIRGLPFEHALNGFILLQGYRYRAKTDRKSTRLNSSHVSISY